MGIVDTSIFAALRGKMQWHQNRQSLLAENIANAETPGYRGRDLADFDFGSIVRESNVRMVSTATTNPRHMSAANAGASQFGLDTQVSFETTPDGNSVVLEDQMMKVTANQMDYQAVTSLYSRSMRMLKTALGRNG